MQIACICNTASDLVYPSSFNSYYQEFILDGETRPYFEFEKLKSNSSDICEVIKYEKDEVILTTDYNNENR